MFGSPVPAPVTVHFKKGPWHKIFDLCFFPSKSFLWAPIKTFWLCQDPFVQKFKSSSPIFIQRLVVWTSTKSPDPRSTVILSTFKYSMPQKANS
jgi:hypothetical protein